MKYKMFIGRWSPFHEGHKYIIDSYVNNGHNVCIAIRDTEPDDNNPFPIHIRQKMIEAVYADADNVIVIAIPDIEMVCVGRGVGYGIMKVPDEIKEISGTKVREGKCNAIPEVVEKIMKDWKEGKIK